MQERQAAKRPKKNAPMRRTASVRSQESSMEVDQSASQQIESDRTRRYRLRQLYHKN
jgi:hypothetical protein